MWMNKLQAYTTINTVTTSGRELEAAVLTKAALKLKDCQKKWEAHDGKERLDEALKFNQRIWSIFQGELANEENPLPKNVRLNLLRLSAFVDRRIFETLAAPAPEKLDAIININSNIAAGLRGSPK